MASKLKFGLILLVAFVVCLVVYLPAQQVLPRLTLPSQIQVAGVSGTLWNGKANQVVVQGVPVQEVHWQINPWAFFTGRLGVHIEGGQPRDAAQVAIDGYLALSPSVVESDTLTVYLPTEQIIARLPLPLPVKAGGRFKIALNDLIIENNRCEGLSGTGQWLNAKVAGTQGDIDLGQFGAALGCREGALEVNVKEPNSFGLTATAVIPPDLQIRVNGQFKPDDSLPKEVHDAARFFGQPNAQGYYQVNL